MRTLLTILLMAAIPVSAAEVPPPGTVRLSLAAYLRLVEKAEANARRRTAPPPPATPAVAELGSQSVHLKVGEGSAVVSSTFGVEIAGHPAKTVVLPLTGVADTITVSPPGPATVGFKDGSMVFAATRPGHYTVTVTGSAPVETEAGKATIRLAPALAPVALTTLDLPAGLAWRCPGAVVASEKTASGRRRVELGVPHGKSLVLELSRSLKDDQSRQLLATVTTVTLLRVTASGLRRTEILAYHVSRGALADHTLELPEGFHPDRAATDELEEEVPILVKGRALHIQREETLESDGWIVISGPYEPAAGGIGPVVPSVPVSARYLALSEEVAAQLDPGNDGGWLRVDLADLPEDLESVLKPLEVSAIWRRSTPWDRTVPITVHRLPLAGQPPTIVEDRGTTTLLTVDGTVVHRDALRLIHPRGTLRVVLPAGGVLWSAQVDGVAVRPLERDGAMLIPLGLAADQAMVELVSVQARAVPSGRSSIELELPEIGAPVLSETWSLLLPERNRYRFVSSPLSPVHLKGPTAEMVVAVTTGLHSQLKGTVVDEGGQPLPGVTITLGRPGFQPFSDVSDADGRYWLTQIPGGTYKLVFS
ncbi:MAG TPA: carboxypeptidase regulatory-like domain-containing protein, partial [Acidobacteria bacterium]|nr:carboxypeptidase regulatory-like domain-containing protein [Acidobacteriota bacterium]